MVDQDIVQSKIKSLIQCLARVEAFLPKDAASLIEDITAQDVITVNLQRAVQVCVDLAVHVIADQGLRPPEGMAEAFIALKDRNLISAKTAELMKAAAGFRNIAVHEYKKLDWNVVYRIGKNGLGDFKTGSSGFRVGHFKRFSELKRA